VRNDGRAADQMRPVKLTPDFISTAEGSVLIEVGKTRVVCTASVDDGVPQFLKGSGKGWVTSEYGMLPRATEQRTPREAARGKQSGRTLEIQRLIGRSLRAVMNQQSLGERTVWWIATSSKPMAARAPHPSPARSWRWRWRSSGSSRPEF